MTSQKLLEHLVANHGAEDESHDRTGSSESSSDIRGESSCKRRDHDRPFHIVGNRRHGNGKIPNSNQPITKKCPDNLPEQTKGEAENPASNKKAQQLKGSCRSHLPPMKPRANTVTPAAITVTSSGKVKVWKTDNMKIKPP